MLSYGQIFNIMAAQIDAEGSQRYLPDQDIIPAINSAIARAQGAGTYTLANKKGPEEILRDITRIGIWQTDAFGALVVDDPLLGYTIANVVAVYAEPEPQTPASVLPLAPTVSQYRSDVLWAGAGKPVRRITLEQAPMIRDNSAMPGNEVLASLAGRRSYSYYVNDGKVWVLPKSVMNQQFVGVAHIERFTPMTTTASTVNLPEYMAQTLASWASSYLAWKQGAGETLGSLASKDAAELFNMNTN